MLKSIRHAVIPGLSGILAGAAGISLAHLIAQFTEPNSSPVIAVGGATIDATPTPLKQFAIRNFGTNDKLVLIIGILVTLALLTMATGIVAARRFSYGAALVVMLGGVAAVAELKRPNATLAYPVPTVIGLAVAVGLLWLLLRARPHTSERQADPAAVVSTRDAGVSVVPVLVIGSRREFLFTGVGVGAVAAVAIGSGTIVSRSKSTSAARRKIALPAAMDRARALSAGSDLKIPGLSSFVTPNKDFYRVDTALVVPQINPNSWRLKVEGMVRSPFSLSYADILSMPLIERDITLTCVSNEVGGPYIGNARWLGVPLGTLMTRAGLNPVADQLFCTATDGFTTSTPIQVALDGRDAMVAIGMNGEPLPLQHGFPARLIVPGLYGFVSACKWLKSINVTTYARKKAYWTQRDWATNGTIYAQTRIDVPRSFASIVPGPTAVAGVAWAQHRGVERVEVSIDGGPWKLANLAPTPGIDTGRQWWYEWDAPRGEHWIQARTTDATGTRQTAKQQPVFPRGATGIQQCTVTVGEP
jgi:DMSO/TMAO reductase YedYZ molybdopterin-dependent catalytic subunit